MKGLSTLIAFSLILAIVAALGLTIYALLNQYASTSKPDRGSEIMIKARTYFIPEAKSYILLLSSSRDSCMNVTILFADGNESKLYICTSPMNVSALIFKNRPVAIILPNGRITRVR